MVRSSGSPDRADNRAGDRAGDSAGPAVRSSRDGYAGLPVGAFLDALAAGSAAPAGGSAVALVLAQAAALCAKTARLSARQLTAERAGPLTAEAEQVRARAASLIDDDARAYRAVLEQTRPRAGESETPGQSGPTGPSGHTEPSAAAGESGSAGQNRTAGESGTAGQNRTAGESGTAGQNRTAGESGAAGRLVAALSDAADVPLRMVELSVPVARLAATLAAGGNPALRGDAVAAGLLAQASARAAAELVTINLAAMPDDPRHARAADLLAAIAEVLAGPFGHAT